MQIKQFFLLVVLCASIISSNAQTMGSVSGYLKNQSGDPLPSLTVKLLDTDVIVLSENSGAFTLSGVKPGRYTLLVSGVGYKSQRKTIAVNAGKETAVSLVLEADAIAIETVTVVGRSLVQETNRQAYNVTAVDAKQLYNTTLDLAGALDRVAGIRLRESGGVGSNFNLSLNGFSGNHVRYFIDGIPMENFGSSFQINNIPINIAERLEVYKGVVPIWLGSDALGGAVNIITGDRHRNYLDVSYSYGSFNTHRTVINAAVTSKKGLTARLSAYQNYSDNNYKVTVQPSDVYTGAYAPETVLRRFHDVYHNETLMASVGFVAKPFADKLLLGITLGKNYKEIQTGARMKSVFGGWHRRGNIVMPTLKYKKVDLIKGLDVTFNANYNLGNERNIDTLNVRYDWYGTPKPSGSNGERSRSLYKYRNNNGITTTMLHYRLDERQALTVNHVFNTFNRKGSDPLNPAIAEKEQPKKTQKNVLGFGYSYNVDDKWSSTLFGKYIIQNSTSGSFGNPAVTKKMGYGLAASYFFTPDLQLKASYELSNRMPEAREIFGDVENQEGNPNLQPEQSNNVNLGMSYAFSLNTDHHFLVNANAIYRYAHNFIYNRFNQNQSKLVADNRDGVRTFGVDGEARYSYKRWLSVGATFTYQYLQNMQKIEPGYTGISPVYLDQMPNIPYLFGNADVSATFQDIGGKDNKLSVGYHLLYVHEFYLYWPSRGGNWPGMGAEKKNIPGQVSHDINVVYSIRNGRYNIGLEGRNITDVLLYDNFSLQKPGRAFYLNLRYFFNK